MTAWTWSSTCRTATTRLIDRGPQRITQLLERGVLNKSAASGGSTSYELMRLGFQPARAIIHQDQHGISRLATVAGHLN